MFSNISCLTIVFLFVTGECCGAKHRIGERTRIIGVLVTDFRRFRYRIAEDLYSMDFSAISVKNYIHSEDLTAASGSSTKVFGMWSMEVKQRESVIRLLLKINPCTIIS